MVVSRTTEKASWRFEEQQVQQQELHGGFRNNRKGFMVVSGTTGTIAKASWWFQEQQHEVHGGLNNSNRFMEV